MPGRRDSTGAMLLTLFKCWSVPANFGALTHADRSTFHLINGLRFFSFAWILAFHTVLIYSLVYGKEQFFQLADAVPWAGWWIWNADKSVDLFFIISGFLIGLILLKETDRTGTIDLPRFYFRRYLRLTPIYLVVALLYWLGNGPNADTLWANLLYVNNFLPVEESALRWTWSLAVEEQFYLLLPLILLWLFRPQTVKHPHRFWNGMLALLALSFATRALVILWYPDLQEHHMQALLADPQVSAIYYEKLYDNLLTRCGPFIMGVMCAHLYLHRRAPLLHWLQHHAVRRALISGGMLLLFLTLAFYPVNQTAHGHPSAFLKLYMVTHHNLFALCVGWFMLQAFLIPGRTGWLTRFLSWRGWQPFSQLTYSMYLVHMLIIGIVVKNVHYNLDTQTAFEGNTLIGMTLLTSFTLSLLLSVLVGILCWLLVEKPFLNLRDRLSDTATTTHANPTPA